MNNLKPCPFCGKSVAEVTTCKEIEECTDFECCEQDGRLMIVCNVLKGGCGVITRYYTSAAEAIEAWNRRDNNG